MPNRSANDANDANYFFGLSHLGNCFISRLTSASCSFTHFGCTIFISFFINKERPEGIEPSSPTWKEGIISLTATFILWTQNWSPK